jgi:hypothetical protein
MAGRHKPRIVPQTGYDHRDRDRGGDHSKFSKKEIGEDDAEPQEKDPWTVSSAFDYVLGPAIRAHAQSSIFMKARIRNRFHCLHFPVLG